MQSVPAVQDQLESSPTPAQVPHLPVLGRQHFVAEQILALLFQRCRQNCNSEISAEIRNAWLSKLIAPIEAGQAIELVLPAFPCKSSNTRTKVLGPLPDAGEKLALDNLANVCDQIRQIYQPGAKIILAADGLVYGDLVGVSAQAVAAYQKTVRRMARPDAVEVISLEDLTELKDPTCALQALVSKHAPTLSSLEHEIHTSQQTLQHYLGLVRFIKDDLGNDTAGSARASRLHVKSVAKQVLQRSRAFASLIRETFPDAFRLSIHPIATSEKFPFALIDPGERWATPWHNVLVELRDQRRLLMKRSAAESQGFRLVTKDGQPWKYIETD